MFKKLLVANRGEIAIRVLRAASEMGIRTISVYTYEDRYSMHRYKADESYQIGQDDQPLKPYLDIEEIIRVAKENEVDAIHPGYGFLSENVDFVRRCEQEGIVFVGPRSSVMEQLGDKIAAKKLAKRIAIPVIEDAILEGQDIAEIEKIAQNIGFPLILKAAAGGGGRGMRIVREVSEVKSAYLEAKGEAKKAFGDDSIFMERFIENPKHIEVQILADNYGNIVHLFERDCSVQRRFQKVIEIAPAPNLSAKCKKEVYDYATKIAQEVQYNNAGTVEFLVDQQDNVYFIEVNPRIQVEHTITEVITGIDIVRSQILIAQGVHLADPKIHILGQESLKINGYAIQCRITTEDPLNDFKPDYGTLMAYRNAAGYGIRLDEGSAYQGMKISPFFDSMIVKVTASGRTLSGTSQRMLRALSEFRVRGVTTNILFLEQVIGHPVFKKGDCGVNFIKDHPELFQVRKLKDSSTKLLNYIGNIQINGHPDVKIYDPSKVFRKEKQPDFDPLKGFTPGYKDILVEKGRDALMEHIANEKQILFTDTTYRDAHQSLVATRVRTKDILAAAGSFAQNNSGVFSSEVWGGATFDVAMRFLHECPWERLAQIRQAMPNVLLQMLFRGSNAVGYSSYPKNVIQQFIEQAANHGIDIFRIFDSLNNLDSMVTAIDYVNKYTNSIAQGSICYTGDVLRTTNNKYDLNYYVDLALRLQDAGAHMLAVKDMAGLLKPQAAHELISTLKQNVSIPIALHSHDTAGTQIATYLRAIEAGVDSIDCAIASFSGTTSQPNLNSLVALLQGHQRENTSMNLPSLNQHSNYWDVVREKYYPFESDLKSSTAEVYDNEIPGGQYSNLRQQAEGVGLGDQLDVIKKNYAVVNQMFGDIVKVTPSSKVVGDMALFMTANNLSQKDVLDPKQNHSFPASVVGFFNGDIGIPYGGFPEELRKIVLKNEVVGPSREAILEDIDLDLAFSDFNRDYPSATFLDFLSYQMFPKVFADFYKHRQTFGDVQNIPTSSFFYPVKVGQEIQVKIAKGKTVHITLRFISTADELGYRTVSFGLNGGIRIIKVKDNSITSTKVQHRKVEDSKHQVGAPLQGSLSSILVKVGDKVEPGTPLFVIEAMKMESNVTASTAGVVTQIYLPSGVMVDQNDAVIEIK
ncbi:pyruvate carboxylase [Myroides sp. LJL116]